MKTWILVADRSRARILAPSPETNALDEIADLVHPESSLREGDVQTDRPGHFTETGTAAHAGDPNTDFKHQMAEKFAIQVVSHLEAARQDNRFDKLAVIAAPLFLGVLREKLTPSLKQITWLEIDKDYTKLNAEEIREHLPAELPEEQ